MMCSQNNFPFFSVFIPAKGRPEYLDEAIQSVLLQKFQDMELVISNNGGDQAIREVVLKYTGDLRVRYVEQPIVLNMPTHWEKMTRELVGDYILVLTDRSVMKKGMLNFLYDQIVRFEKRPDIVSWAWDLYYDHLKILLRYHGNGMDPEVMDSNAYLDKVANGNFEYPYYLPRGLNSCVRNEFVATIRRKHDAVFRTLNPDFTFGYLCLLHADHFIYIDSSLFISQGLKVSNGGNSFSGDASPYFNSLKLDDPFQHVPLKLPLVQNGIYEDLLAMISLCGRDDLLRAWDRPKYYLECLKEIDEKRGAGILQDSMIDIMERDVANALEKEPIEIKNAIRKTRTPLRKLSIRIIALTKKLLGDKLEIIRKFVLLNRKNGEVFVSVLDAAGFEGERWNKQA